MEIRGDDAKHDHNKLMWDLLPLSSVEGIVEVLTYGAQKYKPNGWKLVPEARDRYFAALMRHLKAWQSGELRDSESGLTHLSHAATNLMFLIYFDDHKIKRRRRADV